MRVAFGAGHLWSHLRGGGEAWSRGPGGVRLTVHDVLRVLAREDAAAARAGQRTSVAHRDRFRLTPVLPFVVEVSAYGRPAGGGRRLMNDFGRAGGPRRTRVRQRTAVIAPRSAQDVQRQTVVPEPAGVD